MLIVLLLLNCTTRICTSLLTKVVAKHQLSMTRDHMYLDPRDSLGLLAHKHCASVNAAVVSDVRLPEDILDATRSASFAQRRKCYQSLDDDSTASQRSPGRRRQGCGCLRDGARGADDPAAIALLVSRRTRPTIETTPNPNTVFQFAGQSRRLRQRKGKSRNAPADAEPPASSG
jgi:hypothetical protein